MTIYTIWGWVKGHVIGMMRMCEFLALVGKPAKWRETHCGWDLLTGRVLNP